MKPYESDLIAPDQWRKLYPTMPRRCQKFVEEMEEAPDCMGLGHNDELGWFIAGSGQGPDIYWQEKATSMAEK
jgi:hypothetical protein